ncbi:MAG TPA: deoxyribose-phosphate aldolase [Anaeromyxobacteraceae bacterium]|nr:deoxyribose-phosphate aldolase [Anaeromyxobacteraceae bacterium]
MDGLARLPPGSICSPRDLAPLIDHTLLREDAGPDDLARTCAEAREHGFATVCVRGHHVAEAARLLEGSGALPIAVVDFPCGEGTTLERVGAARRVVADGAREVDVVLPLALLRARDHRALLLDLEAVVKSIAGVPLKVILETAALSHEEKVAAAALCAAAGAAFVKTSTGYGPGGATAEDVALLRAVVGDRLGVKASGGVRTAAQARALVEAGASRIGASASVAIVTAAAF